jgi:acetate kinase
MGESSSTYLLAINCGSSSIKGKLYEVPTSSAEELVLAATLGVNNINAKGEKLKIKVQWENASNVEEEKDGDEIERKFGSPLS